MAPSRRALLPVLVVLLALVPARAVAGDGWRWPLAPTPEVVRGFEAPADRYGPGHRGADLLGTPGATVRAVADGVVRHVGVVAGVAVVSVDHGGEISTYQPVAGEVEVGNRVAAGDALGRLLLVGSHCVPRACLHLGRRIGREYADPLALLRRPAAVRLFTPTGALPVPPLDLGPTGSGELGRPAEGPVTSPFGMRTHPVTGVHKLHDGLDIGAPCGAPVRAAADGVVVGRTTHPAYGNRLVVSHGDALTTSYNHLSRFAVADGTRVRRGQLVGSVGTTGLSTGCHLHFMVTVDGTARDPARWL
ncbi:peptidoglycan DD-metalloendopeptidase family protein [Solicola sp. PLA-1-18]|uniref:peptidoglycan DD-metalloendopeptidase family protein n=1 Tax=Solicola sp. PLA-1-18 TaxID=3380532 RepID=UPI003B7D8B4B